MLVGEEKEAGLLKDERKSLQMRGTWSHITKPTGMDGLSGHFMMEFFQKANTYFPGALSQTGLVHSCPKGYPALYSSSSGSGFGLNVLLCPRPRWRCSAFFSTTINYLVSLSTQILKTSSSMMLDAILTVTTSGFCLLIFLSLLTNPAGICVHFVAGVSSGLFQSLGPLQILTNLFYLRLSSRRHLSVSSEAHYVTFNPQN